MGLNMSRGSRPLLARLIMALAAVGLFFVGYQWGNQFQHRQAVPLNLQGVLLRAPVSLPTLELSGPQGMLTNADLEDHWSLIAFGSPGAASGHRAVARLIEIANRLADQPELHQDLRLLLISADDLPGLARDFERLTPSLRVLSTPPTALSELQQALGADTTAHTEDGVEPPPLFLIGPQQQLVALFPGSQPAASVAEDLKTLAARPQALPKANAG
jgi:hypothetical protein